MAILTVAEAKLIKQGIHDKVLPSLDPGTIWITKWAGKTPKDSPYLTKALRHAASCAMDLQAYYRGANVAKSRAADEWREAISYYRFHKKMLAASKPRVKKK